MVFTIENEASMSSIEDENSSFESATSSTITSEQRDVDMTILEDDDLPTNYDGRVDDDDENNEYNFAAAVALRKNLSETFDKHVDDTQQQPEKKKKKVLTNHPNENKKLKATKGGGVKGRVLTGIQAKIQAFERSTSNSKIRFENNSQSSLSSYNHNSNRPPSAKPPTVPLSKVDSSKLSLNNGEKSLLSVYLRVRPTPSTSQDEGGQNTVEIVSPPPPPSENEDEEDDNNQQYSTSIRTYPPTHSNSAKVLRSQHHLHTSSHNTDLMFSKNKKDDNNNNTAVNGVKEFSFNRVFDLESTQDDVYNGVAVPLVDGLFPKDEFRMVGDKVVGQSALLFSYGITNAGKTYTIMGNGGEGEAVGVDTKHGIIPRALHHILHKIKKSEMTPAQDGSEGIKYQLNMSYMEIYNEQIFDLLPKETTNKKESKEGGPRFLNASFGMDNSLRVREGRGGRTYVRGLGKHQVKNFEHGIDLARSAMNKRHTSSNNINSDSSRSHSICQFELVACPPSQTQDNDDDASVGTAASGYSTDDDSVSSYSMKKKTVRMWIVDLAGSERSKRTGTFSKTMRQKEAALINSSLMKLMRCLQTLKNNQSSTTTSSSTSVVPFRESKLTHLFMDHLSGSAASRTCMVVNINPSLADFDETQHVLSYATVAKSIRISEADFNRKRRAIQLNGGFENKTVPTHGEDGRPINKKATSKSPPRKIARLVKKLSPRAAMAKRREQMAASQKRKQELSHLRGGGGSSKTSEGASKKTHEAKRSRFAGVQPSHKNTKNDMKALQDKLDASEKGRAQWESECNELRKKLSSCEDEIRSELASQTEEQLSFMREQHNEIVQRLRQQIVAEPDISKSVKKVQRDKADALIEELMDKNDECEEEMKRIEHDHEIEISNMKTSHSQEIQAKDEEISRLKQSQEEEIQKFKDEVSRLTHELVSSHKLSEGLKVERDEIAERYQNLMSVDTSTSTCSSDLLSYETENDPKAEKENYPSENPAGTPRMRRLPRGRCSEVACANVSPTNPPIAEPVSSSKKSSSKKKRGLRAVLLKNKDNQSPFAGNDKNRLKSPGHSKMQKQQDLSLGDDSDLIFPSSQAEYDDISGLYQRPRGRAPVGRIWDAKAGGWRVEA